MKRLTFKDSRGRNTLLISGQEYHGPIADRLAAYEETGMEPNEVSVFALDPEAFAKIVQIIIHHPLSLRDIADTSERLAPLLTVMGPMCVLNIRRWAVAHGEGRLIVLPCMGDDVTIERGGLSYKGDHWNLPELTAFAEDPTTRTGKRVALFNMREVKAALEAQEGVADV